jgi:hypothetical protein
LRIELGGLAGLAWLGMLFQPSPYFSAEFALFG